MKEQELSHVDPAWLRQVDVHELLPQQEPFVMIGCLTAIDDTTTVTETTVAGGNILVDDGCLSASGLIENVAQTCAARIGYINKYVLSTGVQIGVIGAIRNLVVNGLPRVGDTITTRVEVLGEIMGMTLASARVTCGSQLLLTTEIKIAVR